MTEKSPTFASFNHTNSPDVDYIKSRTDDLIGFVRECGEIVGTGEASAGRLSQSPTTSRPPCGP